MRLFEEGGVEIILGGLGGGAGDGMNVVNNVTGMAKGLKYPRIIYPSTVFQIKIIDDNNSFLQSTFMTVNLTHSEVSASIVTLRGIEPNAC